jgi:hypothetical protein
MMGKDFWNTAMWTKSARDMHNPGSVNASEVLRRAGIPGLSYLDAGSRGAGDGTRNFVVWDQDLLDEMARRMAAMAENKK